jgi:hypothetical protein
MLTRIKLGLLFKNVYQLLLLLYLPICDMTYSYLLCKLLDFTYLKINLYLMRSNSLMEKDDINIGRTDESEK